MRILYDHKKDSEDRHEYAINQGGELNLRVSNGTGRKVTIIFKNGKFHAVEWDVADETWGKTRSAWHVMGAIARAITDLEAYYAARSNSQHNAQAMTSAGEKTPTQEPTL